MISNNDGMKFAWYMTCGNGYNIHDVHERNVTVGMYALSGVRLHYRRGAGRYFQATWATRLRLAR